MSAGHIDIVRLLLGRGADIHAIGYANMTALHLAARDGRLEIVKLLIERGAPKSERVLNDILTVAAMSVDGTEQIRELLRERRIAMARPGVSGDADSATARSGWPPLGQACGQGHPGVVRALLARGADIDQTFDGGRTALMCAAFQGHAAIVDLLLDVGADAGAQFQGQTAYSLAKMQGHTAIAARLSPGPGPGPG